MDLQRVANGIANTAGKLGKIASRFLENAINVEAVLIPCVDGIRIDSAPIIASPHGDGHLEWITKTETVPYAAKYFPQTSIQIQSLAPVHVVAAFELSERMPVYNLTVEAGEYYANGILVHNCDAVRYFVKSRIPAWRIYGGAAA
jgi:hypothetical protein